MPGSPCLSHFHPPAQETKPRYPPVSRKAKQLFTSQESRRRIESAASWQTNQAVFRRISRGTGLGWRSYTGLLQPGSLPG
jgi:hypothetical protein